MTKRKKYGKKGHGGEKSHEFFRRFTMRRPVIFGSISSIWCWCIWLLWFIWFVWL